MPVIHTTITKKLPADEKAALMEYMVNEICKYTSTKAKNIYAYVHEVSPEDARKAAPVVQIDWTAAPDRNEEAKQNIMHSFAKKLYELEPQYKDEIVVLISDVPKTNAVLGYKE